MVGLDVVRGVAIGLVLLNHASPVFGGAGVVGVTIFFALSGFLITGILDRDVSRSGRVNYKRFYRNRALRLLPPLLFLLAFFSLMEGVLNFEGQRSDLPQALLVAITYTTNLPPFDIRFDSLFHLWTLATEEQFYLLWPLFLAFIVSRIGAARGMAFAAASTMVLCMASLIVVGDEIHKVYALPTSWFIAMIIGACFYYWAGPISRWMARRTAVRHILVVAALVTLGVQSIIPFEPAAWRYLIAVPAIAASTGVLLIRAKDWPGLPSPVLRPLVWLGTISYAAYLWNLPVVHWLGEPKVFPENLVPLVVTLAAAAVSWWVVEKPTQAWRAWLDERARSKPPEQAAHPAERVLEPTLPEPAAESRAASGGEPGTADPLRSREVS